MEGEDHLLRAQEVRYEGCDSLAQEITCDGLIVEGTDDPFHKVLEDELLQQVFSHLQGKQKQVMYMCYIMGYTQHEIAKLLNLKRTTMKEI